MKELVSLLSENNLAIASIESLTAGLFASKLAEVSNASAVLKGGLVTYQTSCKEDVLHIDKALISEFGVISKEVADAMAIQGFKMFNSDVIVSFSGNAGPQVMDEKEVGLVHMAIYYQGHLTSYQQIFLGERNEIRLQAVEFMKEQVKNIIKISKNADL